MVDHVVLPPCYCKVHADDSTRMGYDMMVGAASSRYMQTRTHGPAGHGALAISVAGGPS